MQYKSPGLVSGLGDLFVETNIPVQLGIINPISATVETMLLLSSKKYIPTFAKPY